MALTGIYFLGLPLIVIITLLQFLEGLIDGHSRASSSGRVGLLGFSLGGYVAAAPATRDERVAALGVLYGGMPDTMVSEVKHLPPLIELHGTADRNVPPAKGEELVKLGKAVGTEAEYIVYPGGHHGFDFSDTDPMTADALDRIVRFFESRLGGARLIMEVSQPIGTNGLMLPLKQVRPGIRQFDRCDSTLWTAATSAQTPRSGIDARHRRRQSRIKIAALIDIDRAGERITERRLVRVRHLAPDQGCIGDLQRGRERHRLADRVGRAVERVAPGNCPLTLTRMDPGCAHFSDPPTW